MCIVHGSQMQTRLCELWRRKEGGTEWAAGLLGLVPVYCTSSSGRAVDNICHALYLRNAAVLGGGSESISNYRFYEWTFHEKEGQTL